MRSRVNFPQPDGPRNTQNSSCAISKFTSRSTGACSPNAFEMPCKDIAATASPIFGLTLNQISLKIRPGSRLEIRSTWLCRGKLAAGGTVGKNFFSAIDTVGRPKALVTSTSGMTLKVLVSDDHCRFWEMEWLSG